MQKDFNNLITTFKSSIKTWDYFVNWKKVFSNSSDLEISLNKLNYLLGKDNLEDEFRKLKKLKRYLNSKEIELLKEIAQIMRKENPTWGV